MADALTLAKKVAGGPGKLGAALGISSAAVSQWSEVPPRRVLDVERITGVSRHLLRPDLYPNTVYVPSKITARDVLATGGEV